MQNQTERLKMIAIYNSLRCKFISYRLFAKVELHREYFGGYIQNLKKKHL